MARRRNLTDLDPQRICIIKPSAFGCVVQALPLLGAVRQRFPGAAISWVIRDDLQDLLAGHPDLAESLVYRRREGPRAFLHLLRQLRSRDFDLAIDLQGLLRSGLMTLSTRAPVRMGLESAREGASLACNVVIDNTGRKTPAADRYWRVAEALGVDARPQPATIFVPRRDRDWARTLLDSLPRPIIAVHPGAMWETKRCPPEVFATVLARANARFGGSILVIGTAGERPAAATLRALLGPAHRFLTPASRRFDRPVTPAGSDSRDPYVDLTAATTLKQLAALLAGVDLLLCNDSGPMHLAAALQTPVVGMFTCTDPILSGPQGQHHQTFCAAVPCAASYCKSCPRRGGDHLQCHRELPVDRISQAVQQLLAAAMLDRVTESKDREEAPAGLTTSAV